MPFVHVRSLPLGHGFDPGRAVRAISSEFARATETDERHVTVTWQTLEAEHYAQAGQTAATQPAHSHPLLVELFAPDFHPQERIEEMLHAAAAVVSAHAGIAAENVLVDFRPARSGQVFDGGELVRW